jgi:hypothetical protein
MARRTGAALVAALLLAQGCRSASPRVTIEDVGPLPPVKQAAEEVVVAAWADPAQLQEGGGVAQILVRLQKRNRQPYAGVEVRLQTSRGRLFSDGRILVTDARGMTRDRLTARSTATLTLNAGGTRYSFRVPVAPDVVKR